MKSIQSKIILLIFAGILVTSTLIGGIGIRRFSNAIDDETVKTLNWTCGEKAQEINVVMERIEQSVDIMSEYAINNLDGIEYLSNDPEYLEQYTNALEEVGTAIVGETDGAVGVYIRFNPEITSPTAGFFKVKKTGNDYFEKIAVTDLSKYSVGDMENLGWYYGPVNTGKPTWIEPYYNSTIDVYMISYIVPIYYEKQLIGIVGMDIDTEYIKSIINDIHVYETGHAFLTDKDFNILHSEHYKEGMSIREFVDDLENEDAETIVSNGAIYEDVVDGTKMKLAFRRLSNGMCLAVTVPVAEIDATKNALITQVIIIGVASISVFSFSAWMIAKTIVRPLKDLNVAAKEIANGNLDVSLICNSKDEIGTLADSLSETAHQLKIRIDYINNLAYIDKLTGTRNNTAYLNEVAFLREDMRKEEQKFAVFVIDINGLKSINDNYGHEYGNELIIAAAKNIERVFGNEHAFRIGGDEFAVIFRGGTAEECDNLKKEFELNVKYAKGVVRLSAAVGYAVYDRILDDSYDSVFRRADTEMYKVKQQMKEQGETSTILSQ